MSQRATCWSLTINNPTDIDLKPTLPSGWHLTGQIEQGAQGTQHYQGMLSTPQVRFSAVKKVFPRAHIEPARNKQALEQYVHKSESRVSEVPDMKSPIPSLFDYQNTIASKWNDQEWSEMIEANKDMYDTKHGELILKYVDCLVARDIRNGQRGVEYIGINPMWRQSWKTFGLAIISRQKKFEEDSINGEVDEREEGLVTSSTMEEGTEVCTSSVSVEAEDCEPSNSTTV